LARKVARIWEEELGAAREVADAWRRVLRMKAGDPDATAGLERARSGNLRRTPPPPVLPTRPPGRAPTEPPLAPRLPSIEAGGTEVALAAAAVGNGHAGAGMYASAGVAAEIHGLVASQAPQGEPEQQAQAYGD